MGEEFLAHLKKKKSHAGETESPAWIVRAGAPHPLLRGAGGWVCSCQQPLEPLFWAFENNRQALYMSANICRPSLPGELRGLAQASAYPVPDGRACSGVTRSPFPSLEHTHTALGFVASRNSWLGSGPSLGVLGLLSATRGILSSPTTLPHPHISHPSPASESQPFTLEQEGGALLCALNCPARDCLKHGSIPAW